MSNHSQLRYLLLERGVETATYPFFAARDHPYCEDCVYSVDHDGEIQFMCEGIPWNHHEYRLIDYFVWRWNVEWSKYWQSYYPDIKPKWGHPNLDSSIIPLHIVDDVRQLFRVDMLQDPEAAMQNVVWEFKQKIPDALKFYVTIDELRKFPSMNKMEFRQVEVAIERVAHLKLRLRFPVRVRTGIGRRHNKRVVLDGIQYFDNLNQKTIPLLKLMTREYISKGVYLFEFDFIACLLINNIMSQYVRYINLNCYRLKRSPHILYRVLVNNLKPNLELATIMNQMNNSLWSNDTVARKQLQQWGDKLVEEGLVENGPTIKKVSVGDFCYDFRLVRRKKGWGVWGHDNQSTSSSTPTP